VTDVLKIATVQFEHRADDKRYNLERVAHFVRQGAAAGARLVCARRCAWSATGIYADTAPTRCGHWPNPWTGRR